MFAITEGLKKSVEESLTAASFPAEGLIPVAGVSAHYCTLSKQENSDSFKLLFETEIDGRRVYIYHKF